VLIKILQEVQTLTWKLLSESLSLLGQCSLGLETGVNVGSLVVDNGEDKVGGDQTNLLVVSVCGTLKNFVNLGLQLILNLIQRVLLKELAEDFSLCVSNCVGVTFEATSHVHVAKEGAKLRG
jgi:hypothetical protein